MKEVWKDIDFGSYAVSNLGRIKNTKRNKLLSPSIYGVKRYCSVNLYTPSKGKKTYLLHRLVAEHFCENVDGKPQVNHIDGDRTNNRADNLEWCTQSENVTHAYKIGLNKGIGQNHHKTTLCDREVEAIRLLRKIKPLRELADFFNVSISCISTIQTGKTWGKNAE